jgi:hypothetical protein
MIAAPYLALIARKTRALKSHRATRLERRWRSSSSSSSSRNKEEECEGKYEKAPETEKLTELLLPGVDVHQFP